MPILVGKHLSSGDHFERGRRGSSFQRGHKARLKARSLGYYAVNKTTILTPVNDRFPVQAFGLEVSEFSGFAKPVNWRAIVIEI